MYMSYVEEQWRDVTMGKHKGDWEFIARRMNEVAEEAYKQGLNTADEELESLRIALGDAEDEIVSLSNLIQGQEGPNPPPQPSGSCSQ